MPLRAGVFNRHWATAGGAEKFAGAIAQHLARQHDVWLLSHQDVDLDDLGERLDLDLSACRLRVVPHATTAVTEATRDLDFFLNGSHRSRDVSAARRSAYLVSFVADYPNGGSPVAWGPGIHLADDSVTWTDGAATLLLEAAGPARLTVELGFQRPDQAGPVDVDLLHEERLLDRTTLGRPGLLDRLRGRRLQATVDGPAELALRSATFVPAEVMGGSDGRTLGAPVVGVSVNGRRVVPDLSMRWLDSYDLVLSNSVFSQTWTTRRWGVPSQILTPPVTVREAAAKEKVVLGVGRFFAPGEGHQKKQRELVAAFRQLVDAGVTGWELHLVGGCGPSGQDYLEQVRRDGAGYPVVLHPNASGGELASLVSRASVFWHLAGLGEDPERCPERLEHFGISTAEAMVAGAVPVVLRAGGLVETVTDGVDGLHVDGVDELARRTRELIDDPARLAQLSAAAALRGKDFADFDGRVARVLQPLLDDLEQG